MITETGDNSMPFVFVYDEAEWAAVVATFPSPLADGADLDAERKGLEYVATSYLNLMHHHRRRSKNGFPTKAWQQKRARAAADLANAEKAGTIASVLSDLREDLRRADAAVEGWGMLGRGHQGRKDAAREWPYLAALAMWKRLGGDLRCIATEYHRARREKQAAPLIRFLIAALTPIIADHTPGSRPWRRSSRKRARPRRRVRLRSRCARPRAAPKPSRVPIYLESTVFLPRVLPRVLSLPPTSNKHRRYGM